MNVTAAAVEEFAGARSWICIMLNATSVICNNETNLHGGGNSTRSSNGCHVPKFFFHSTSLNFALRLEFCPLCQAVSNV